jgi:hypothetical protein
VEQQNNKRSQAFRFERMPQILWHPHAAGITIHFVAPAVSNSVANSFGNTVASAAIESSACDARSRQCLQLASSCKLSHSPQMSTSRRHSVRLQSIDSEAEAAVPTNAAPRKGRSTPKEAKKVVKTPAKAGKKQGKQVRAYTRVPRARASMGNTVAHAFKKFLCAARGNQAQAGRQGGREAEV